MNAENLDTETNTSTNAETAMPYGMDGIRALLVLMMPVSRPFSSAFKRLEAEGKLTIDEAKRESVSRQASAYDLFNARGALNALSILENVIDILKTKTSSQEDYITTLEATIGDMKALSERDFDILSGELQDELHNYTDSLLKNESK